MCYCAYHFRGKKWGALLLLFLKLGFFLELAHTFPRKAKLINSAVPWALGLLVDSVFGTMDVQYKTSLEISSQYSEHVVNDLNQFYCRDVSVDSFHLLSTSLVFLGFTEVRFH